MDHFVYHDGRLMCEDVAVENIAAKVGTPLYLYSANTLRSHYRRIAEAFAELNPTICFSVKSCQNLSVCRVLQAEGSGFDVVSGGELFRALQAGGEPEKIVFAGVGKSDAEIMQAMTSRIGYFNVESEAEMENLIRLARQQGQVVRAALRVNPDVDPRTHRYTSTGKKESKFGVDLERARRFFDTYGRTDAVRLCGIHLHIGSPVNSVEPYVAALTRTLELIDQLATAGFRVEMVDIGGGFGAYYDNDQQVPVAAEYARAIIPLLRGRGLQVVLEPGRSISANAGILLTRVQYLKQSGEKQFVIIDAAMNDLIRPALYEAYHHIWPAKVEEHFIPNHRRGLLSHSAAPAEASGAGKCQTDFGVPAEGMILADVVGPVCESGDFLAKGRALPPVQAGDLLAVFTAGAYGFVMSSNYNSRPRAAEVLVDGSMWRVVRRRESYADLIRGEVD